MHENLHKNVNENIFVQIFMSFYEGHIIQLNTANFLYSFSISNGSPVLLDRIKFPNFDGLNDTSPNSTGPRPLLQKGRKINCFKNWIYPVPW